MSHTADSWREFRAHMSRLHSLYRQRCLARRRRNR